MFVRCFALLILRGSSLTFLIKRGPEDHVHFYLIVNAWFPGYYANELPVSAECPEVHWRFVHIHPAFRDARPGKGFRALPSSVAKRRDPTTLRLPSKSQGMHTSRQRLQGFWRTPVPCRIPRVFLHGSSVAKNYCTADLRIPALQMQSRCPWTPVQGLLFTRLPRGAECFSAVAHCDDSGTSLWMWRSWAVGLRLAPTRCACSCRVPHTPGGWKRVCCKSERLRSERRARCM